MGMSSSARAPCVQQTGPDSGSSAQAHPANERHAARYGKERQDPRGVACRTATAEPGLQASLQELDALLVRCLLC